MKQSYTVVSFQDGMVERIKQDMPAERGNGNMTSVLWMENFNPNIVVGSAVKREGYRLWVLRDVWSGPRTNLRQETTYDPVELRIGDLCSFWDTYDMNNMNNHVIGTTAYAFNKPVGQTITVAFVRFYDPTTDRVNPHTGETYYVAEHNATIVAAHAKQVNSEIVDAMQAKWVNVWTMDKGLWTDPSAPYRFPGWFTYGIMRDHTLYGGSLIYATDFNREVRPYEETNETPRVQTPVTAAMYPVYVFRYWDISIARDEGYEHFWNIRNMGTWDTVGVPLVELEPNYLGDEFQRLKVAYPSMWFVRNEVFAFVPVGGFSEIVGQPMTAPIEFCLFEQKVREYPSRGRRGIRISEDISGWHDENHPHKVKFTENWPYVNDDMSFTESLETLRGVTPEYNVTWSENDLVPNANTSPSADWQEGNIQVTWNGRTLLMQCLYRKDMYPGDTSYRANSAGDPIDQPGKMRDPDNQTLWPDNGMWVLPVRLPNYLENNNPRYWMEGEKIPLVATIKVNGIELKVADYVYEVRTAHSGPWCNLFSLSRATDFHYFPYIDDAANQDWWAVSSRRSLFWSVKDNNMRSNGRHIVPKVFMNSDGIYKLPNTYGLDNFNRPGYAHEYIAHCWEPFNPSLNVLDVRDFSGHQAYYGTANVYASAGDYFFPTERRFPPNANGGYEYPTGAWPYLTEGNIISFALRVKKEWIDRFVDAGLQEVNVYIVECGDRSQLRSQGLYAYTKDVPDTYYSLPKKEFWDDDPQNYRLLHSFKFRGEAKGFADIDDFDTWQRFYNGEPGTSSAWGLYEDRIISMPQNADGSFPTNDQLQAGTGPNPLYTTPEFVIWDYGTTGKTLTLNSNAEYWDGLTARCVAQVKGRVFIAGLTKTGGQEEQGIVRFSAVQSGVISLDVFNEADVIRLGGKPITALLEYREQLWIFTQDELHRVQMPVITDPATWEVLDKIDGQGVREPKLVTATPHGVVWANDAGLWISDGRMPQNIADPILGAYVTLMTGHPYPFQAQIQLPVPAIRGTAYNQFASLEYTPLSDELHLSFPVAIITRMSNGITTIFAEDEGDINQEVRLVYSFPFQNWRSESYELPVFGSQLTQEYGKL